MQSERRQRVFDFLQAAGIDYELHEHPAAATVETALRYWADIPGVAHCKNLFLRNHKGNSHYLVIVECHKQVNIPALWRQLAESRLSFASAERMMKYLGVEPGSVSLFGLINDRGNDVCLLMDSDLAVAPRISFHPNDNTASLVITNEAMRRFIDLSGNSHRFIEIPTIAAGD